MRSYTCSTHAFTSSLRDEGLVDADEPFKKLMMLGMVLQDGKKM